MKYEILGQSGLRVSELCFGSLIIGRLQANLSPAAGAEVIEEAIHSGVNFIDTAELYGTYPHIRQALARTQKNDIVIASRCYAYSREQAVKSLERARTELDRDVIDIFGMHEQETELTLKGHREALEYYIEAKQKGLIRAVVVSTHNVEVVNACAGMPEVDIIHPIVNFKGLGIGDGTINDMLSAVKKAFIAGKGIYSMKALGGGNLFADYERAMNWVLDIPEIHSIAVGMQKVEEVRTNISFFTNRFLTQNDRERLRNAQKHLHIDEWCTGCGECVKKCKMSALTTVNGKAKVDSAVCVKCGYCSAACPQFAIKIF